MQNTIWLFLVTAAVLLWSATDILYKIGIYESGEEHVCLKGSVCIGTVFFGLALVFLMIRTESFSIWESALRYWPMTLFGILYAVINTISLKGFLYNEVTVQSPVQGISGGTSTVLLVIVYLVLGRADSVAELLTPMRAAGIAVIMTSMILLSAFRNREFRNRGEYRGKTWMTTGLGTLIFPVLFSLVDALETIVTGICLDTNYGGGMPEEDSIIIVGTEYAVIALGFWLYIWWKEKKPFNPFGRRSAPMMLGALADNIGIGFYSFAMAINSISTDALLAAYPLLVMAAGRVIMKEKLSSEQYVFLFGIAAGSSMVISDTIF